MALKRASFSLNPNIGHFVAGAAFVCALVLGFFRFLVLGKCLLLLSIDVFMMCIV